MKTRTLVTTGIMLAMALVFQLGFAQFSQPLVGPLVNMTLFLTVVLVGMPAGILVGCCTPLAAFALGIMPMLPIVPVVMLGNTLLVLAFRWVRKLVKAPLGDIVAVGAGAVLKFAVLAIAIRTILPMILPKVPPALVQTFSLPQLLTALVGGALAIIMLRFLPENLKRQA